MKLEITIMLGNDAMETAADVSHSIQKALAADSQSLFDALRAGEGGAIFDGNGNRVGAWAVSSS